MAFQKGPAFFEKHPERAQRARVAFVVGGEFVAESVDTAGTVFVFVGHFMSSRCSLMRRTSTAIQKMASTTPNTTPASTYLGQVYFCGGAD